MDRQRGGGDKQKHFLLFLNENSLNGLIDQEWENTGGGGNQRIGKDRRSDEPGMWFEVAFENTLNDLACCHFPAASDAFRACGCIVHRHGAGRFGFFDLTIQNST